MDNLQIVLHNQIDITIFDKYFYTTLLESITKLQQKSFRQGF